jgi:hypothetical protein
MQLSRGSCARKDWSMWLNSEDIECNRALWRVNDAVRGNPAVQVVVSGGHELVGRCSGGALGARR